VNFETFWPTAGLEVHITCICNFPNRVILLTLICNYIREKKWCAVKMTLTREDTILTKNLFFKVFVRELLLPSLHRSLSAC